MTHPLREFHRVNFHTDVLAYAGATVEPCTLLDISLHGCLVEFPASWHNIASVDRLEIRLEGGLSIQMTVSLAHHEGLCAGYCCEHIDLDSLSTLRRMLELNLGDSHLLERDIHALLHGHDHPVNP